MLQNVIIVFLAGLFGVTVSEPSTRIQELENKVEKLHEQVDKLAAMMSNQGADRFTRVLMGDMIPSAFYAYKSKTFGNIAANRELVFDTVITNVGGEYDANTGIFTANGNGIYAFSWVILVSGRHSVHGDLGEVSVEILQNGQNRGTIHADTEQENDDDSASGFVILSLESGNTVNLRTTTYVSNQGEFISTAIQGRWSFAGFRIA